MAIFVEATLQRGRIVLTPKLVVDRSKFPNADDEYTPAQRRVIGARLDESEEDLKKGRTAGPFNSASEMIAHMKGELRKRAKKQASPVRRGAQEGGGSRVVALHRIFNNLLGSFRNLHAHPIAGRLLARRSRSLPELRCSSRCILSRRAVCRDSRSRRRGCRSRNGRTSGSLGWA